MNLDVLPGFRADLERLQTEIGERAHIHVIDFRVAAHFLVPRNETAPVLLCESPSGCFVHIGANGELVSDVPVGLRVLVRDCAGPDHSHSHMKFAPVQ